MKPAGRPKHCPSVDDKATFSGIPCDVGNSGAAEAGMPSTANDSLSMKRPASSFRVFTLVGTADSKLNITKSTKTRDTVLRPTNTNVDN